MCTWLLIAIHITTNISKRSVRVCIGVFCIDVICDVFNLHLIWCTRYTHPVLVCVCIRVSNMLSEYLVKQWLPIRIRSVQLMTTCVNNPILVCTHKENHVQFLEIALKLICKTSITASSIEWRGVEYPLHACNQIKYI